MSDATRTAEQAAEFLKAQHARPSQSWRALCLSLQRQARGLPGVYPSALAAAVATPKSERVLKVGDLRRGMVAYSDDPHDSNDFGHIYFIAGWDGPRDDPANLLTWSNDVKRSGGVDLVPITFYRANWGDGFQFGATWLNGFNFAEYDASPKPDPERAQLGDNYRHAINDIRKVLRYHEGKGHVVLANRLRRDLQRMVKLYNRRKMNEENR